MDILPSNNIGYSEIRTCNSVRMCLSPIVKSIRITPCTSTDLLQRPNTLLSPSFNALYTLSITDRIAPVLSIANISCPTLFTRIVTESSPKPPSTLNTLAWSFLASLPTWAFSPFPILANTTPYFLAAIAFSPGTLSFQMTWFSQAKHSSLDFTEMRAAYLPLLDPLAVTLRTWTFFLFFFFCWLSWTN